ncbi:MAG: HAMP domain-containing histidine kinase [Clostridia bacterium]|nr:HAMP domain-containing histidine kinase [Clostridia bacterium]
MLFIFIPLFIIAGALLYTDSKSKAHRWGSAMAFLAGSGALGVVIRDNILPYAQSETFREVLRSASTFFRELSHQVGPYSLLIYGIIYSGLFKNKRVFLKIAPYAFFIPVAVMYILYNPLAKDYEPSYLLLSLYAVPYAIAANSFLLYSFLKEKRGKLKQQRLLICVVVTPSTLFSMLSNYILLVFGVYKIWQFNSITITTTFIIFIIFSIKYGFMGFKLKVEKQRLDSTIKAISSGTTIFNHTLKNEVNKINMCMNNIESSINSQFQDLADIQKNIKLIFDSTGYLAAMSRRIHEHAQEIALAENPNDISKIIQKALHRSLPFIKEKDIKVVNAVCNGLMINCDSLHMQEVFLNLIKNAIEAMDQGGELYIGQNENKRSLTILIQDNGSGISKENLAYIYDPFFTTKKHSFNFGLGLSYCYSVLQKHGGDIEIQSEENVGTTVYLNFPGNKILTPRIYASQGSYVYE